MTRRDLVLVGWTSAAAALALLSPGRASRAFGPIKDVDRGRIYAYAWAGGDGGRELVQGIFALDPERMEWTRVADQSDSATFDTDFRVSRDGRLLAVARRADRGSDNPEVSGVSVRDLTRGGAIRKLDSVARNPIWSADDKRFLVAVTKRNHAATKPFRMESAPSWSPDGRRIAISVHAKRKGEQGNELQSNHRLILLDVAGGDPVKVAPPLADGLGDPQWAVSWKP